MKPLTIQRVRSLEDRKKFISLPWKVYKEDPYWVPPLVSERLDFIDPEKNPTFQHSDIELFMAMRGEEVVGTIAALINHRHIEYQGEEVGFFGLFEVIDDPEAAEALLETAETWVRERGFDVIRGPANFSTNDEVGLLVDGFDDQPRILMTYNPRRYVDYIEKRGYFKSMDLWAWAVNTDIFAGGSKFPKKLVRVVEKVRQRENIHIRKVDMKNFEKDLAYVKKLYNSAWAKNWGFIPMNEAEIDKLAEELKPILDPDLVLIAEIEGEPVGFSLTLPDLNQPLKKAYPHPDTPEWWTMAKMLWHWKLRNTVTWARVFALGVEPEHRAKGVDALFYYDTAVVALKKGIKFAEMSWILENNDMMNRSIELMGGRVYKTYRVYDKNLT